MTSGRATLLLVLIFLVGATLLRRALGIEWDATSLRETIGGLGVWAPLLFIALVALRFLILIPKLILLSSAGVLFGVVAGSIYGAIGLTLGGLIRYGIVHWAGPEALLRGVPRPYRPLVELGRSKVGTGVVVVASGYPIGPTGLVQIGAAIAGMSLLAFLAAVATGSLVRASLLAAFGDALIEAERLPAISAVLLAVVLLPLAHPAVRRFLREQSQPSGADDRPETPLNPGAP